MHWQVMESQLWAVAPHPPPQQSTPPVVPDPPVEPPLLELPVLPTELPLLPVEAPPEPELALEEDDVAVEPVEPLLLEDAPELLVLEDAPLLEEDAVLLPPVEARAAPLVEPPPSAMGVCTRPVGPHASAAAAITTSVEASRSDMGSLPANNPELSAGSGAELCQGVAGSDSARARGLSGEL